MLSTRKKTYGEGTVEGDDAGDEHMCTCLILSLQLH